MKQVKIDVVINLTTGASEEKIRQAVTRGIYWGLDCESYSVAPPSQVDIDIVSVLSSPIEGIKLTEEKKEEETKEAIAFLKWCNTRIYKRAGGLGFQFRVQPQHPEYNTYVIINELGDSVFPVGKFLSFEEVYQYWIKVNKQTV